MEHHRRLVRGRRLRSGRPICWFGNPRPGGNRCPRLRKRHGLVERPQGKQPHGYRYRRRRGRPAAVHTVPLFLQELLDLSSRLHRCLKQGEERRHGTGQHAEFGRPVEPGPLGRKARLAERASRNKGVRVGREHGARSQRRRRGRRRGDRWRLPRNARDLHAHPRPHPRGKVSPCGPGSPKRPGLRQPLRCP